MRLSTPFLPLTLLLTTPTLSQNTTAPLPTLTAIDYWGSACPAASDTLTAAIGLLNTTTNSAPLTITIPNFTPTLGSFGSTLRMCDIVSRIEVGKGWKVRVNARGTVAMGVAAVPGGATMYLRGSYWFGERAEVQSVGMLAVGGPLEGQTTKLITAEEGDKGVVSECGGGELDMEFQARAVEDDYGVEGAMKMGRRQAAEPKSWVLRTDVDLLPC